MAVAVANRFGCPIKHPSPTNSSDTQECDNGFLALLGYDSDFDLALLDIENRIGGITLRKNDLLSFDAWQ